MARSTPAIRPEPRQLLLDVPLGLALGMLTWWSVVFGRWMGQGGPPWTRDEGHPEPPGGPYGPYGPYGPGYDGSFEMTVPLAVGILLLTVGLALRRFKPWLGYGLVVVGVGVALAAGVPAGFVNIVAMISVYTLARLFEPRAWLPWSVATIPMVAAGLWPPDGRGFFDPNRIAGAMFALVLIGLAATVGMIRRTRREAVLQERDADLRRSAYEERLRIAREVHDLIGHSLSVINMQAGVALHVLDKRPEQAEESLRAIRQTSKDALAELRSTLAVFRDPGRSEPTAPEPGLARLENLIAAMRQAGRTIELTVDGEIGGLPPTLDHTAYRIVQEALTNVVRHAGDATADVSITRQGRRLLLAIVDHGPPIRSETLAEGHGISGMRERARAVGGTLTVQPQPGGGVAVRAQLPIPAPANEEGER
ncbi:sensor histidine kinase [Microlunatus speluncae]|uniref:sensor histidine kinase n=1 Tax=Microlunatus speluncae TaxID=2594267 RepID=UPI0012661A18|nr:sensor histidine kinase [Microlunatus speluncae]